MFVIPPAIIETIENVDWEELLEQAQECRPAMDIVQKTWDKETLAEMIDGKVSVPDSVINDAVAEKLAPEGNPVGFLLYCAAIPVGLFFVVIMICDIAKDNRKKKSENEMISKE